ncbi:MAG TPA: ABC transporter substrate-binding protein [Opitutaceae bacterium]|jgi:ABC-type nitrate/sulfonate/bicarbonate transport system substrate-binding protein|nr:ABC transporter substrate-binding protein [Opitutaceae bacterium]
MKNFPGNGRWARLALALAALAAAESAGRADPPPQEIAIQLGWIANVEYMGEFVAVASRYFEAEGLHCTLIPGGPTASVLPLVDSGKVLIGLDGADGVARARRQGARLKIVGATLQRNPTSIMSLAAHPFRRPEELIGCRLGVPQANRTTLYGFLRANGINPRSLTLIPVQNDPAPLVNGEIDAMVSFLTSQPIQLRLRGIPTVTLVMSDFHYKLWTDDIVVSEDTLADPVRRSEVVRALRALARGWQAAVADPKLGAQLAVTRFGRNLDLDLRAQELSAAALAPLVATPETRAHGLLTMSPEGMEANVAALRAIGIETTVGEIFDPSLIAEAYGGKNRL